jgi:rubrerythrin
MLGLYRPYLYRNRLKRIRTLKYKYRISELQELSTTVKRRRRRENMWIEKIIELTNKLKKLEKAKEGLESHKEAELIQVLYITGIVWQCSYCHRTFVLSNPKIEGYNYCPVCGAKFKEYVYLEDD